MADSPRTRAATADAQDGGKGNAPAASEPPAAEEVEQEPTVTRELLLSESEAFFGEPTWHVAAALASLPANKKNFTVSEVKDAIKKVLAKEVS